MKRHQYTKLIALAMALCMALPLVACDDEAAYTPDSTDTPQQSGTSAPPPQETSQGGSAVVSPLPVGGAPTISFGDSEEGELSGDEEFGFGFVDMSGEGEFDPDKKVAVTRHARAIRRIVKQDVYGRELPEYFYFYRNLLGGNEQKMYDQIYANAVEMDPYFEPSMKVHHSWIHSIFVSVRFDNPDVFWLGWEYSYTYDGNGNVTSVTLTFDTAGYDVDALKQQFYNYSNSLLEYVMTFDYDIDKVKYCHDLLTNINDYGFGIMNQSAYSALCIGETVCAGYTAAFTYLMQRLGIPCVSLYGYAGEDHLWNMVYLDDDWYEMDVTWNDPIGNPPNTYYYDHFNLTTGQMGNRTRIHPSTELPAANGSYYSYYNFYGNRPGSDFGPINYGSPSRNLPHVYPGAAQSTTPSHQVDNYEEVFSGGGEERMSYEEIEEWLLLMSDEEWDELWDYFYDFLDDDEIEYLEDMDWDEFVELIFILVNE